ncbi:GNAT family N-acetyltransferase [Adhaeribacter pallidiroseus]|uniref:GNAT family N-acetyltransferase n=1 Tax=Adhaeribacter pallidiroseus TaxID=2072847 RepID=UPI0013147C0B|nr:GNAT family N-acetyltransferase [Adhaeribacter pallidiroseus]
MNKVFWDSCVHHDPAGLVTALSWYLDVVAPQWEGWIKEENGQYIAVVPIVKRKIAGAPVITQPLLTQQFGIYTPQSGNDLEKYGQELITLFLKLPEAIEKYCFGPQDYQNLKNLLPFKEKTNWILPLQESYHLIRTRYSTNRTRDLEKARKARVKLQAGNNLWLHVFTLYRANVLNRLKKKQQATLLKIIPELVAAVLKRNLGRVYVVFSPTGQVVAGALFILYKNRLTYLLPAASEAGKKIGASTFLIDQVCQQFAGSKVVLDFEGSSIPSLAHFYQSFGAQPEIYGLLENYNMPAFLKFLNFLKPRN